MRMPLALCIDQGTTWRAVTPTGNGPAVIEGRTPVEALASLPVLLHRLADAAPPAGGTVLLASAAAARLGLPDRAPRHRMADHAALNKARAVGWHITEIAPWMTFWRADRPSIHIGMLDWLNTRNFPLWDDEIVSTLNRMATFQRITHVPYFGKHAGLPALELLRDHLPERARVPMWRPGNWSQIPPVTANIERQTLWRSQLEPSAGFYQHSYDANLQYLSVARSLEVACGPLRRNFKVQGMSRINPPGYYYVTVPGWYDVRMPHPLGTGAVAGRRLWIASPTLDLADELADAGQIAAPEIHESWTEEPARVFRKWAEIITSAVSIAKHRKDALLVDAVKGLYQRSHGMLMIPTARVYRPDWAHAITAKANANLWRRAWQTGKESGRWPDAIAADTITYRSTNPDPCAADSWPSAFPQKNGPGGYKVVRTTMEGTTTP